ncbi:ferrochelatase [Adlercreutzia equolifaciens]|uniref:ferrochelatase n=1 Tax=Adlercreutzia equolifaciens TaxID=446660 RepID=UPI0023AF9075|nr:ferrochelatase [Adlercreutzia equolifaciens]MDE8703155.1 ferrochelatase [Adlercreutzia equolifaciens]
MTKRARRKNKALAAPKIGVIIANTGTPAAPTPKAVKKYLGQFLMDRRICPMPWPVWWCLLHTVILRKRAKASAAKYEEIWMPEGSPLNVIYGSLVRGLNEYYAERGLPVEVRAGMSYGKPSLKQAVKELKQAGCTQLVVLPMYPQTAYSTVGSVTDALHKAVRRARWKYPVEVIEGYSEDAVYVRAIAASIRNAGFREDSNDRLLFSFHSIPLKDIEAGDTYELQTGATSLAVAGELGLDRRRWTISYQSRFDKGRTWLSPFTRPTLVRLAQAAEADSRLFIVCPNFSVDCLETLYDIPYELEPLYRAALAGEFVDADEEPGALENTGKTVASCHDEAHRDVFRTKRRQRAAEEYLRGSHARQETEDDFIYVPCLNRSRAHVRVLTHLLAPYVGDEA